MLEGFRVDLKIFLGLAKPNQCCQTSAGRYGIFHPSGISQYTGSQQMHTCI